MNVAMKVKQLLGVVEPTDETPCNVSGHDWQHKRQTGYFARPMTWQDGFNVVRKDWYKCSKCGKSDFRQEKVGKVNIDGETDRMKVSQ